MFETVCIQDMPFEQYKALIEFSNKINDEVAEAAQKPNRTTYRVVNKG